MANFTPSRKTAQDFNNGVEYIDGVGNETGDALSAETINNVIESQLWTQALATNSVDNTEANNVGTASIELTYMPDGTPKLKVKNIKGATGAQGNQGIQGNTGNGISSTTIRYTTSTSGTTAPTTGWQSAIPTVAKGSFLWTRTVFTYTDGTSSTSYTSAYQGQDGQGAVTSVNGQTGAVTLTPADVGAVNKLGDTMTGPLKIARANNYSGVEFDYTDGWVTLLENDPSDHRLYYALQQPDGTNKRLVFFPTQSGTLALNTQVSRIYMHRVVDNSRALALLIFDNQASAPSNRDDLITRWNITTSGDRANGIIKAVITNATTMYVVTSITTSSTSGAIVVYYAREGSMTSNVMAINGLTWTTNLY